MTPAKGFVQPKTEWGEPDLQGVWTSDAALGIPRERPEKFGTRAMLSDEEFAEAEKADEARRKAAENAVGAFRNDGAYKTRSYRQTSLLIEPADGRTPAFTAEALKRAASRDRGSFGEGPFNSPLDFTLYDRCMTRGIVGSIMPVVYGNGNRIVQAPGMVIISYEMVHDTRVVYTDGRAHLTPNIRQWLGDSRGRWEGNTLVIETTNFTNETSIGGGNGNGLRHSRDLKLTERITRIDKDEIRYEVHVDDPKTYTQAVHDLAAAHVAARIRAAPVRVSRGQLHAARLARCRTRGGPGDRGRREEGDRAEAEEHPAEPRRRRAADSGSHQPERRRRSE